MNIGAIERLYFRNVSKMLTNVKMKKKSVTMACVATSLEVILASVIKVRSFIGSLIDSLIKYFLIEL